mmetsp:Transcript_50805/g.108263  ORF Transcript_50805/g.108263 Transcript_50805/m.108263 type:complete len:304 (-) Transcript_50805:214-1125(-)
MALSLYATSCFVRRRGRHRKFPHSYNHCHRSSSGGRSRLARPLLGFVQLQRQENRPEEEHDVQEQHPQYGRAERDVHRRGRHPQLPVREHRVDVIVVQLIPYLLGRLPLQEPQESEDEDGEYRSLDELVDDDLDPGRGRERVLRGGERPVQDLVVEVIPRRLEYEAEEGEAGESGQVDSAAAVGGGGRRRLVGRRGLLDGLSGQVGGSQDDSRRHALHEEGIRLQRREVGRPGLLEPGDGAQVGGGPGMRERRRRFGGRREAPRIRGRRRSRVGRSYSIRGTRRCEGVRGTMLAVAQEEEADG